MTYNVSSGTLNPTIPYHTSSEMHQMSGCEFLVGSAVAEKCFFGRYSDSIYSVSAASTV